MRNSNMSNRLQSTRLFRSTRGAGFVEYIILVGLVALFCIVAYRAFGTAVTNKVNQQGTAVGGIQ
jgi:Flp pilus assembly pilin Flp